MKKTKNISDVFAKYLSGEMSEMEKNEFLQMTEKNEKLKKEFLSIQEIWDKIDKTGL